MDNTKIKSNILLINTINYEYIESSWYEILSKDKLRVILPFNSQNRFITNLIIHFNSFNYNNWVVKKCDRFYMLDNIDNLFTIGDPIFKIENRSTEYGLDKVYYDFLITELNYVTTRNLKINLVLN